MHTSTNLQHAKISIYSIFFVIFSVFFAQKNVGQCPTGDITFTSQQQIDNFLTIYPTCTAITGNVIIDGSSITHLNGLNHITTIGGNLEIKHNIALSNLYGLSNLTNIGGSFNIYGNAALSNLNGLNHLTSIGRHLDIFSNALINLNALSHLTSIGGQLWIENNYYLNDMSGLQNINPATITGGLSIANNPELSACHLPNLCTYLAGSGQRFISGNKNNCLDEAAVLAACALPVCTTMINITFSSQEQIDQFIIDYPTCTQITGYVTINGSNITNLNGLSHLTNIGGYLEIHASNSLTNTDGLSALTSIGGFLKITHNNSLTNLNGLSALTSIGGDLRIANNNALTNILGLQNINPATIVGVHNTDGLLIKDNANLAVCNLPNFCTYLAGPGVRTISGNLANCLNEAAVVAACGLPCPSGEINFSTQASIDNFIATYPFCTEISGSVTISGSSITNLNGLRNITKIGGKLTIKNNSNLNNLNGLNALKSMGGDLEFENNSFSNIDALSNLTIVGGHFYIGNNNSLANLNGMSALTSIGGYLYLYSNNSLTDILGLQNINPGTITGMYGLRIEYNTNLSVCRLDNFCTYLAGTGERWIYGNKTSCLDEAAVQWTCNYPVCPPGDITLTSQSEINQFILNYPACTEITGNLTIGGTMTHINNLNGLNNIKKIGGNLEILSESPFFTNFEGLSSLTTVGGNLEIRNNPILNNLNGLNALTNVGGNLNIFNNLALSNLNGFSKLTNVGGYFYIVSNNHLTNLNGLSSLTSIGGALYLGVNPALSNLSGLSALASVGGNLIFAHNNSLTSLDGLSGALTSIGGYLEIRENPALINLNGLSALTSLRFRIYIENNNSLTDITGLKNINPATIGGNTGLRIIDNPFLMVCNLPNFCEYLAGSGPRIISGNAGACINETTVAAACSEICFSTTTWNGLSWSNGTPNLNKKAMINGDLILNSNLEACELEVTANGNLEIPSGFAFTVNGAVTNNATAADFVVASGANLIQNKNVANVGAITVIRESQPIKRLDYTMWSSPVTGQQLQLFSPMTLANRIYTYEGTSGYVVVPSAKTDFSNGKGYLFRAPNDAHATNQTPYQGNFIGTAFNGSVNVATHANSYTSVGNPYASNIYADAFITANAGISTLYFWNNTGIAGANYSTCTLGNCVAAIGGGVTPNGTITVGQGFLVETSDASVNFDNTMRVSSTGIFSKNETEKHRIWLNLNNGQNEGLNQILIGYIAGATNNVDHQIDGKLFASETSAFYNIIGEEKFVIQGKALPFQASDVVALGFKVVEAGEFNISLADFDGLFAEGEVKIYLKDNQKNSIHNLMESPYRFESVEGEFKTRFEVVYEPQEVMGLDDFTSNSVQIYTHDDQIVVSSKSEKILSVELFDLQGRNIHTNNKVNASTYQIKSTSKGVLAVKVRTQNGVVNRKIILK